VEFSFILVHPENPRNIGFAARAMFTSGFSDLRIVSPGVSQVPPESLITGCAAKDILNGARYFETLGEALADCHYAVAFSRRKNRKAAESTYLYGLKDVLPDAKIALVFGKESQGLDTESIERCNVVCEIPAVSGRSFNLGQAVAIVAAWLFNLEYKPAKIPSLKRPSLEERNAFLNFLTQEFGDAYQRKLRRKHLLESMLNRFDPSSDELHLLFGVLKEFRKQAKND
jgi:TrmH family RNA methyltransferase